MRYPEIPFAKALPCLQHSTFAIAPYGTTSPYLTHTSMKLLQYSYLGIPAVCPQVLAGEGFGRFGYRVGEEGSIREAIEGALNAAPIAPSSHLTWGEVDR